MGLRIWDVGFRGIGVIHGFVRGLKGLYIRIL